MLNVAMVSQVISWWQLHKGRCGLAFLQLDDNIVLLGIVSPREQEVATKLTEVGLLVTSHFTEFYVLICSTDTCLKTVWSICMFCREYSVKHSCSSQRRLTFT